MGGTNGGCDGLGPSRGSLHRERNEFKSIWECVLGLAYQPTGFCSLLEGRFAEFFIVGGAPLEKSFHVLSAKSWRDNRPARCWIPVAASAIANSSSRLVSVPQRRKPCAAFALASLALGVCVTTSSLNALGFNFFNARTPICG